MVLGAKITTKLSVPTGLKDKKTPNISYTNITTGPEFNTVDTKISLVDTKEDIYVLLDVDDETHAECSTVCPPKKYPSDREKELGGFRYVWRSFASRIWK